MKTRWSSLKVENSRWKFFFVESKDRHTDGSSFAIESSQPFSRSPSSRLHSACVLTTLQSSSLTIPLVSPSTSLPILHRYRYLWRVSSGTLKKAAGIQSSREHPKSTKFQLRKSPVKHSPERGIRRRRWHTITRGISTRMALVSRTSRKPQFVIKLCIWRSYMHGHMWDGPCDGPWDGGKKTNHRGLRKMPAIS